MQLFLLQTKKKKEDYKELNFVMADTAVMILK